MARIHNLSSKLTLDTSSFVTGLDKARARTGQFARGVGRVGKQVAKFGAAAGAAAVGGLALITTRQLAAIDATAKFADSIGISTEALIGLRHAGEITGVGQEVLDKGLERMVRRLGEVAQGTGQAKRALDQLGLSGAKLSQMTPDQQFRTIADSLRGLENRTQQATAAYQIFGRDGIKLLNTLDLGAKGLDKMTQEAERLGLTFSRVDAAKVEAANDAITRVQAAITGAGQSLTIALAPYIEATAEKLLSMGTTGEEAGSRITDAVQWVAGGIAKAADVFGFFKAAFYGAQSAVSFGLGLLIKEWQYLGKGIEAVVNLIPGMEVHFSDGLGMLGDELIRTAQVTAGKSAKAFDAAMRGDNSKAVAKAFEDIRDKAQANAEALKASAAAKAADAGATDALAAKLETEAANRKKVIDQLAQLQTTANQTGLNDIEIKVANLRDLGATNDQLARAKTLLEQIDDKAQADKAKDILADLTKQLNTLGLDDRQITLFKLRDLGATNDQLAQARKTLDAIDAHTLAAKLTDAARSPADQIEEQTRRIKNLYRDGLIDFNTFDHSLKEVEERFKQTQDRLQPKPLNLVVAGSAEAQRLAFQQRQRTPRPPATPRIARRPDQRPLFPDRPPPKLNQAKVEQAVRLEVQAARGLRPDQDDTPKRQLDVQRRMLDALQSIDANRTTLEVVQL